MGQDSNLIFLGVRGSVPVDGPAFSHFGGRTSCVLVRMGGMVLVLDAGTGLLELGERLEPEEKQVHLLLSHPHLDHILGLPCCPVLFHPSWQFTLYATPRDGRTAEAQVAALMSPPLWPVGTEVFRSVLSYQSLDGKAFSIGPVRVETMEGCHPGGCTVFRLTHGASSLVYATDFELTAASTPRLAAFAQNCSLLLCDGQYSHQELAGKRGYGHSSWEAACGLAQRCHANRLILIHHDPERTDAALEAVECALQRLLPGVAFGYSGGEVSF